jgi:hypothetical protein
VGTSGGFGFPSEANIGSLHVRKNGNDLLIYVYIGGDPKLESSWFLLGGRSSNLDVSEYTDSQIGGSWFDPVLNQMNVYGKVQTNPNLPPSNQVISDPITQTITGVYADVRDSLTPSSSPTPPPGVWYYDVAYVDPSGGYSGARNIACYTSNPASVTLSMGALPSGTYNVWGFMTKDVFGTGNINTVITATVSQLGNVLSRVLDTPTVTLNSGNIRWQLFGKLPFVQGVPLELNCSGFTYQTTVVWRGLLLTVSSSVPTFVPLGNTGYVVFN